MKSTEVYRILREALASWAKAAAFRRTPGGMLGWYQRREPLSLVFWFQCARDGWDPYIGSRFTLEFQRSPESEPGHGVDRTRFARLLSAEDLEQVRHIQNTIIKGLRRPPRGHWIDQLPPEVREAYYSKFSLADRPYEANQDIWLRYASEADVARWATFLAPRLPLLVSAFWASEPRVLARGG